MSAEVATLTAHNKNTFSRDTVESGWAVVLSCVKWVWATQGFGHHCRGDFAPSVSRECGEAGAGAGPGSNWLIGSLAIISTPDVLPRPPQGSHSLQTWERWSTMIVVAASSLRMVKSINFFWDSKKLFLTHWKTVFWATEQFCIKWTFWKNAFSCPKNAFFRQKKVFFQKKCHFIQICSVTQNTVY